MVDDRYEAYCVAHPVFYDTLRPGSAGGAYATADHEPADGWRRVAQDDWVAFSPADPRLPAQGWKIHVGACLTNAERILATVWDYCVPRGVGFKVLRSPAALLARLSKYAPRGYSGKLVTIYPVDEAACEMVLRELGDLLEGEPSPYVLSDLRWGKGPLYVRYGGFANRQCVSDTGQLVPAIVDPAGTLVPEPRGPVFHVPSWVPLPDFLAPHLAALNAVTVADLPYTIERVLHYSNGGGIYAGVDRRTGGQVVLKEGRPYSGLDGNGDDAVTRVDREYSTLRLLAGIPGIPEVYDVFWVSDHRFLAMELVDGVPLSRAIAKRYPLTAADSTPEDLAAYTEWAFEVHRRVEATVTAVNARGLVYGDLHLFNVMVTDDGDVTLVDFEVATPVADAGRPAFGNQGFSAPRGTTGVDIDRYGLACLRLALFLPMTSLLGLSRAKARHFADIIAEHFPVPVSFVDDAVRVIAGDSAPRGPRIEPDPATWPRLRDGLVRVIVASATPEREDRLFPGDIQQFSAGGLGLAYGAAGVLYALSVTGAPRQPYLEKWLLDRVRQPPAGTRLGLYDGLHGAAFALEHLGHRQDALDALDACLARDWASLAGDLHGGLAGIGLNLLHLAARTGSGTLHDAGLRAAELVAERLGAEDSVPRTSGREHPYAGLMRGSSGQALLLLRAYDDTGDAGFLERAAVALRQDLRRCVVRPSGALEVDEGGRTMSYLDVGTVGIGLVLDEYLARRADDRFVEASRAIEIAARSPMYVQPGLFSGRAGVVLYLAGRSASPADDPIVAAQVRRLAWHAVPHGDGLAFPGNALLRLSMDLATGTAGVLLALGAALHPEPVHAPLLPGRRRPVGVHTRADQGRIGVL